jgi:hypothetical protein
MGIWNNQYVSFFFFLLFLSSFLSFFLFVLFSSIPPSYFPLLSLCKVLASLISKDMGPKLRQEIRAFLEKRGEIQTGNRINLKNTIMQAVELTITCQVRCHLLTLPLLPSSFPLPSFLLPVSPCLSSLPLKLTEGKTHAYNHP